VQPSQTFRGFIAVELASTPLLVKMIQTLGHSPAKIKCVEPHNLHLTLKFLGDVSTSLLDELYLVLQEAVKDVPPFEITLKGMGVFPNLQYMKVIWVGIRPKESLCLLAQRIDEGTKKLGFSPMDHEFSPHLTIGRVKSIHDKASLLDLIKQNESMEFGKQTITSIQLKQSKLTPQGPQYTTLKEQSFPSNNGM